MILSRRHFLRGLFAAPAVVAAASLMPIRGIVMPVEGWVPITSKMPGDVDFVFVAAGDKLTMEDIKKAIWTMRQNSIPPIKRCYLSAEGELIDEGEFYAIPNIMDRPWTVGRT